MLAFFAAFDWLLGVLRIALAVVAAALLVIFAVDWLVRTRRLNPFGPVARFFRRTVDPVIRPIEVRVVRAGGVPSQAPWWALVAVVVGGIVLLLVLGLLRGFLAGAVREIAMGPAGIYYLIVSWTFGILFIALWVRVIASWLGLNPYRRWIRWSVVLTEWLLRPLRRFVPPFGMIDVTPLVAFVVLWLLQSFLLGLRVG